MEASRRPRVADPDFDRSPNAPVRLREFDPLDYQRLVVNPFLAVVALIALGQIVGWPAVGGLVFLPHLVQYHCLDCDQTGRYAHRSGHACPRVLDRWREVRRPWFPSSWFQLVVWCWLLGAVAVLLLILLA